MEFSFKPLPAGKIIFGTTATYIVGSFYLYRELNYNEVVRWGNKPYTPQEFFLGAAIFFVLCMVPLMYAILKEGQKILIEGSEIIFYRKNFNTYKEIDRILLSDIDHISVWVYKDGEGIEDIEGNVQEGTYYVVDRDGRRRFPLSLRLKNQSGQKFFDYIREELGIQLRRETASWSKPTTWSDSMRMNVIVYSVIGLFVLGCLLLMWFLFP